MKTRKLIQFFSLLGSTALLFTACSSTSTGETTSSETAVENPSETSFNLFQSVAQIRAEVDPSKAFLAFKTEHLKPDQSLFLQFVADYIDDRQPGKAVINLKLAELKGDQLRVSGDPNLSTVENTLILSDIKATPEELKRMPRKLKPGLNFINKTDYTAVYPVTEEFKTKLNSFNKQFGYNVISESSSIENEIAYLLSGNYTYWDISGLYSEQSFEKAKYSDNIELKKIKFYMDELENGSLRDILVLYKSGKLAMIDFAVANAKDAVNPQTVLTINGTVNTADFQYPLQDKRDQPYAKLVLGLSENSKITDIKPYNKNFMALVQASNVTGDGITTIKKKLEFYAKNKPSTSSNEADNDNWEKSLEQ